jgi:acyl carrier protein
MKALVEEIKSLIISSLNLETTPEQIAEEGPLFGQGLGLDSIDALELALAIHQQFGVKTSQEDERNREIFFSVKSLAAFVSAEQDRLGSAQAAAV